VALDRGKKNCHFYLCVNAFLVHVMPKHSNVKRVLIFFTGTLFNFNSTGIVIGNLFAEADLKNYPYRYRISPSLNL